MKHTDTTTKITSWLRGRLPEAWHPGDARVTVDREEVLVLLPLPGGPAPTDAGSDGDGAEPDPDERDGRVQRFRSETRGERMTIADEAQRRYGRTVSWGVVAGDHEELFTTLAVPVMTRLRQPERLVLETLVEAGVARSRAHALAWCVRLVGRHSADWLAELREAMTAVERVRDEGPAV
ncbi:hypothetical protein [Aquipuribacter nitratireducens]|uniref:Uncharacterized protein n=1 Tax=Aquipuribacter nitratireducens TaxID=650104 RepID=A0ABW0GLF1_9MICO